MTISCVAGSVPTVSVQAPKAAKHNANEALRLLGSAALDQNGTASALSLAWSCSPDIGKLSDPLITSTGSEQANLVVLPGVLPSGCAGGACSYTFTLTATHNAAAGPRAAFAQQTILMNVPPSGGNFEVVPSTVGTSSTVPLLCAPPTGPTTRTTYHSATCLASPAPAAPTPTARLPWSSL